MEESPIKLILREYIPVPFLPPASSDREGVGGTPRSPSLVRGITGSSGRRGKRENCMFYSRQVQPTSSSIQ